MSLGENVDPMLILWGLVGLLIVLLGTCAAMAKPDQQEPRGVMSALGMATRVFMDNLAPLLLMSAVVGGLGAALASTAGSEMNHYWMQTHPTNNPQVKLMSSELPNSLVILMWGCTAGAFASAFSLYFWVRHEKKEAGNLYDAVNFALARLPRVLPAHAKAFSLIWLGNIVVIPGIWFALQYAFVDAIATLDEREKDPLSRFSGSPPTVVARSSVLLRYWPLSGRFRTNSPFVLHSRTKGWPTSPLAEPSTKRSTSSLPLLLSSTTWISSARARRKRR